MIPIEYIYVLLGLIYLSRSTRATNTIFLICIVMIVDMLSIVSSVVDFGFVVIYGYLGFMNQWRQKDDDS